MGYYFPHFLLGKKHYSLGAKVFKIELKENCMPQNYDKQTHSLLPKYSYCYLKRGTYNTIFGVN